MDRSLRAFLPLPIKSFQVAALISFPPIAVLALSSFVVLPPLVLALHRVTGLSLVALTLLLMPVLVQGFSLGTLLSALARAIALRFRMGRSATYPLAVVLWILVTAVALTGWHGDTTGFRLISAAVFNAISLWPLVSHASVGTSARALPVLELWLLVACIAAVALCAFYASLSRSLAMSSHGDALLRWHGQGRFPLIYLQLVKLTRRGRIAGSLFATSIVLVPCWWAIRFQGTSTRPGVAEFSYILAGSVLAHVPLIARGSSGEPPPEVALLRDPRSWSWSLITASILIAVIPGVTFIAATSPLVTDRSTMLLGVGIVVFGCGMGAILGTAMRLGDGMSGAEAGGLFIVGITVYLSVIILGQAFGNAGETGLALLILGLFTIICVPEIENRRYNSYLG